LATKASVLKRHGTQDFYYFETYNRASLHQVAQHCTLYPLLGEKSAQFQIFIKFIHYTPT